MYLKYIYTEYIQIYNIFTDISLKTYWNRNDN